MRVLSWIGFRQLLDHRLMWAVLGAAVALAFHSVSPAQVPTGTVFGHVVDASGGAVPEVAIQVTNEGTGFSRKISTDATGDFTAPQLTPGRYTVTASKAGFAQTVKSGVNVNVDARVAVDLQLQVGATSEKLTVSAAAVQVESGTSSLDQALGTLTVGSLPLNGRNFVQLASLSAGVTPVIFNQQDEGSSIAGKTLSVNIAGGRGNWNSWLIDGVEVKNPWFNTPSVLPSVDSIQEFKVMRGTFSAQYGNATGVINLVTKSGTNAYHGTAFEFLRNDALDARNFFAVTRPAYRFNQFGGNLGGPIIRNRTFFFGYYEGFRTRQGTTLTAIVPTPAQLDGNLSNYTAPIIDPLTGAQFPGNIIPRNRISTVTRKFNAHIPAPNFPQASRNILVSPMALDDADQVGGRGDQVLSDADQIFVRYMFSNEKRNTPGYAPLYGTTSPYSGQNVVLSENHVFGPAMINSVKLAYNRGILQTRYMEAPDVVSTQLGLSGIASRALPTVNIAGFNLVGSSSTLDQGGITNSYQFSDVVSVIRGRHDLRFGGSLANRRFQKVSDLTANGSFAFDGRYTKNALADYLLGLTATAQDQIGRSSANLNSWQYSFFVEDNFKATNKLTINLGWRYDYSQPWWEGDRKEGYFDTASAGGRLLVGREPADFGVTLGPALQGRIVKTGVPKGIMQPDRNNFAPRVGLAYAPGSSTVVRAAYGIFYLEPNANEASANFQMAPFVVAQTFTGTLAKPVVWDALFPGGATLTGNLSPQGGLPTHGRTPYVQQWTISVQRAVRGFLVEAAYEGNRALHLDSRVNINQALLTTPGVVAEVASRRPFPLWGDILARRFRDRAHYHGMHARLETMFSSGLTLLTSYTYSKAIDTQSRVGVTEHQDSTNLDNDRGLAAFDMRHNFVTSLRYELPFGRGRRLANTNHKIVNGLVGGWQTDLIVNILSGLPVNPTAPASLANVGGFTAQRANCTGVDWRLSSPTVSRFFNTSAFSTPQFGTFGTCGRDVIIGPNTREVNLAMVKEFPIREAARLQFRGEFLNLFNHPNFGQPVADVANPNFGAITSARAPRQVQLALRAVF